jgi:WD40 repeat protein
VGFHTRLLAALALMFGTAWGPSAVGEEPGRTDLHGDPLPAGAIARLGTSRLQHAGPVHALVYSPDGKWLASAGADKVIRLWDAETGKAGLSLEGHQGAVCCLAFVPAGEDKRAKILVSASFDKTIHFWDLQTGRELSHLINHPGTATALTVSPDGKLLASGGKETSEIFLWQVEDGKEVRRWKAHREGVMGLAFAPDGKTIASGGVPSRGSFPAKKDDYAVALWETGTGKAKQTLNGHTAGALAIALSSDGNLLASSGFDEKKGPSVLLWDPESGKRLRAVGGRLGIVPVCLALSKDGKTLAASDRSRLMLFDTGSGAEHREMAYLFDDHVQALAFSPDGLTLASGGERGRITLWDVARRTARIAAHGHAHPLTSVAVSPDGKTIATTSFGEPALLWDRATSKPLRQLKQETARGVVFTYVWCAAFSPDGRTVALSHQRDGITLWDAMTGRLRRHIPEKNNDRIVSVAFSPDGKWLASESIDQPHASLWDTSTGELKRTFARGTKRFEDSGTSVAISPDSRLMASTATNGLNVWELGSGKLVFLSAGGDGRSVAFSPGGFLVATAGRGVKVFDAATGTELAKFDSQLHHYGWRAIAFSPDGRLLAVADTKRVKLWEVAPRRELNGFEGHCGAITSVAFTPDGQALISAAEDCTAMIWDLGAVAPPGEGGGPKVRWDDLYNGDPLRSYAAYCRLRASPDDALTLLRTNLKPAAAVPAELLADLIKKLDSDSFAVRDQATRELKEHGLAAEKALRRAARDKPSLEAGRRIDMLVADLDTGADWRRTLTALKLLEEMPAATAREFLQSLATGDPDCRLTRESKALLQRVLQRGHEPKP